MDITTEFLTQVLSLGNMNDKYLQVLLDHKNMFQVAFKAPSFDHEENYQLYEFLGDVEVNNAIVWYFYQKYPQLRHAKEIKTLTRLKNLHVSNESFSSIALQLGFKPYIKCSPEEKNSPECMQKLLEDVFEAFIGVVKVCLTDHFKMVGVASQIIYNMVESIFQSRPISLEHEVLFDAKTRLKELFDKQDSNLVKQYGKLVYVDSNMATILKFSKTPHVQFVGQGVTSKMRQKNAAQQALDYLKTQGYDISKKFNLHCDQQDE